MRSQWPNFENLVKGHFELSYVITMLKQTNLAARFLQNLVKVQVFNALPNKR